MRSRILWIRIKVKSWIWIRIKVKSWIRIGLHLSEKLDPDLHKSDVMQIRNPAYCSTRDINKFAVISLVLVEFLCYIRPLLSL
jgi:hypothetical protein